MKHIKLFEQFSKNAVTSLDEASNEDMIFDWLPYDNQIDNPIQSSIPESLSYNDLLKYCSENDCSGIQEAGLFIAHSKNSGGGFTRYIATSLDPMKFDVAMFNKEFELKNENKDVDAKDLDVASLSKGASLLGRFGAFDFKPNPNAEME